MNLETLILKLLEYKNDNDIEELKTDLKRICTPWFGNDQIDIGYIDYLYKYYNTAMQHINNLLIKMWNNMNNIKREYKKLFDKNSNNKNL